MKDSSLFGFIVSLTILGTPPLLATLTNPAPAFADAPNVVRKVVLLDLYQRGTTNIAPFVTKVTFLDSYALATWLWGKGGGETVLINENDKWRVIVARSGGVKASTLVQSGVPLDVARNLISRDRGAPEKQPPVADVFAEVLPQLQQQTDALILLPSQIPLPEGPIYINSQVGTNQYKLNLELKRDCGGDFRCTFGSFTVQPLPQVYSARELFTRQVPLAKGIWAYFTPLNCDTSCTPSTIEWGWEGFLYRISLKGAGGNVSEEEAVMVKIANSAILAGAR